MLTVLDVLMIFSGPDFILQCVDNVSVHIFSGHKSNNPDEVPA